MSDKRYLVCLRIVEGRRPAVVSTRAACARCGEAVWKANSNPAPKGATILCTDCLLEVAGESRSITIMPPTEKQLESIRNVLKQANN